MMIDQHHIGILPQSVERNLFAVRRDVEGSHGRAIIQARETAGCHPSQIEQPEIL